MKYYIKYLKMMQDAKHTNDMYFAEDVIEIAEKLYQEGLSNRKVKEYIWLEVSENWLRYRTPIGTYDIYKVRGWRLHSPNKPDYHYFEHLVEAKAFAVCDFEERIKNSLEE